MIEENVQELIGELTEVEPISGDLNNAIVETGNYNKLEYKPQINNVILQGNLTLEDLSIQEEMDCLTNNDIERLIGD